jgi:glycine cleavage system aminomethyltransferase T/glycine/D-amino acid oxidase-like deaminating enzyme
MPQPQPTQAQFVIVGGGIIGLSVAYHLTKLGHRDVLLLERKQLTCGTTWHAAGLVTQLRATENMARLAQYTAGLFSALEKETGQSTGFSQTGSITVARTPERLEELRRGASMGRSFGLEVEIMDPAAAARRVPLLNVADIVGAAWIPSDGKTNPVDTARAFAMGAKMGGATILENTAVRSFKRERGRIVAVVTDSGEIACATVAICGGMWSRQLGNLAGVTVPLHAAEHFYIVTDAIEGLQPDFPTVRDLDGCFYAKEDAGKLLVGAFEPRGKPWGMQGIREEFCFDQLPDDEEHLAPILEHAAHRIPVLQNTGMQLFFNGPESFTPDNRFLMGPAPDIDNLYVATGFNSCGIESSGGAGRVMAHWMSTGEADADYWEIDVRRAMPFQRNARYLHDRTAEAVGLLYSLHWPYRCPSTARGVRRSPLHDRLAAQGAFFAEAAGWERANWFAGAGRKPEEKYSFERGEWFERSALEHAATRDAVTVFDQTSFAHFLVQGRGAVGVLQQLACNDVDVAPGRIVYTPWLNTRGGMESDVTIARLSEEEFLVVTAGSQRTRDLAWLRRHISRGDHFATVTDQCSAYATIAVMGPKSRELMQRLSPHDFGDEAFPFGAWREIEIAHALAYAFRMTFVGELGYELHVPAEFALGVYDALVEQGASLGLAHGGYLAIDSLRMECGYRDWGHDVSDEDTPLEAGLGFTVAWDKKSPFIGREALLPGRGKVPARRLVHFALRDPRPLMFGAEPVFKDSKRIGHLKSTAFGHTVGRSLGMGYLSHPDGVSAAWLATGGFEVEVAGERVPAVASLRAFYDADRTRVKGGTAAAPDLVDPGLRRT